MGAFGHYLNNLGEENVKRAIELASEYATITVQSLGTQSSYPKLDEIDKKFKIILL